ncbi:MAG: alpha/beta fold hydrolase [Mariprofundaceae bacterium]|nr:alpha/beta fold hydrolase [Mariprofundaceae bacterium]
MPLVFLHGWGQSQQIWFEQKKQYPDAYFLNLSGHGGRLDADDCLEDVMQQCPQQAFTLVGWSLGGMLAIRLAVQYPSRIKALILLSSTPSFSQRDDWLYGCDAQTLMNFEQGLLQHEKKTMKRFFSLMFQGEILSRETYRSLESQSIDSQHFPSSHALKQGLNMLVTWDLRSILPKITQATCVIHGQKDAIIPAQAGQYLAQHIPHADYVLIDEAAHAPFLTQPQRLADIFARFMEKV